MIEMKFNNRDAIPKVAVIKTRPRGSVTPANFPN